MSSTRLPYDKCELTQSDIQRVDSLNYHLFVPKYSHHSYCQSINKNCYVNDTKKTDIENDLRQLDRKTMKCSDSKFQSMCGNTTNCEKTNKDNFIPVRVFDRNVAWTNIEKPKNNGITLPR